MLLGLMWQVPLNTGMPASADAPRFGVQVQLSNGMPARIEKVTDTEVSAAAHPALPKPQNAEDFRFLQLTFLNYAQNNICR